MHSFFLADNKSQECYRIVQYIVTKINKNTFGNLFFYARALANCESRNLSSCRGRPRRAASINTDGLFSSLSSDSASAQKSRAFPLSRRLLPPTSLPPFDGRGFVVCIFSAPVDFEVGESFGRRTKTESWRNSLPPHTVCVWERASWELEMGCCRMSIFACSGFLAEVFRWKI